MRKPDNVKRARESENAGRVRELGCFGHNGFWAAFSALHTDLKN